MALSRTCASRCPPAAQIEQLVVAGDSAGRGLPRRISGLPDPSQRDRRAAAPHRPVRSGDMRCVPGGNRHTVRATASLSLHQLHELRTAVVHHHRLAVRSRADVDGCLHDVCSVSPRIRESRGSSFSRAADCLPRVRSAIAFAAGCRHGVVARSGGARGRGAGRAGRPYPGPQGHRRIPVGGRRHERDGRHASCAGANSVPTNRLPSC